jgi:ABC-type multidrug transport system ATPase subunit
MIAGVDIVDRPARAKRAITAVYQETLFNQALRPIAVLLSYARFYNPHLSAKDVHNVLLKLRVLEQDLRKPLFKLSGGTKKKVEFAKCLLADTPIYLFDEPFAGFDKASREVGRSTLEGLRTQGKAILLCDHEQRVLRLSDRMLELREGQLAPIVIEEVRQKMQVEAEVKGWREEMKEELEKLSEIVEITVQTAPLSEDEVAAILQKAGIDRAGKKTQVIYMDGEPDQLLKKLGLSAGAAQVMRPHDKVASHVILTITLTEEASRIDNLDWLRGALTTQGLEVLRLERIEV